MRSLEIKEKSVCFKNLTMKGVKLHTRDKSTILSKYVVGFFKGIITEGMGEGKGEGEERVGIKEVGREVRSEPKGKG